MDPVAALIAQARAAHPTIAFDEDELAREIRARASDQEELASIRAGDLLLALACARGDADAIATFDRAYGHVLDVAIAKSPTLGLSKHEFRQLVRTKLFVAEGGKPPRIASYSGRGALESWVRVTAARAVVDLSRAPEEPKASASEGLLDRVAGEGDPEIVYLRHAYGPEVPRAFADALSRLSVRQRNLLRQRYLHGLAADKLAPMYGVHRATAFGWLEEARRALLSNLRQALAARMPGTELESMVDLLGSELHVSVRRLLESHLEDER